MPDYGSGGDFTVIMEGPFAGGGGGSTSNMTSISAPVASWKGATSPYSQVVAIGQINVNTKVDIQLSADQIEQLSEKRIAFTAENTGGVVTLYAVGDKPPVDCVFQATLTDVVNIGDNSSGAIRGNTVSTVVRMEPSLLLSGGKMEGDIDMDGHELTNLRAPYKDKDAAPKDYVDKTAKENADTAEANAKTYAKTYAKDYSTTKSNSHSLTVSGWSDAAPFTQTITVEGLSDEVFAQVYPVYPAALTEKLELAEETAKVRNCTRSGNTIIFECWEEKPIKDIPVVVEVYV